jgi:outer membrane protein assembly factor BamB
MHSRTLFVGWISLSLIAAVAVADPGNWSQWRGNARDAQLTNSKLPSQLKGNLQLLWERPHGPSYSGPLVFDGLVYTTETMDKTYERVTAYKAKDGSVQWTAQWEGAMSVPFFAAANGDWIRATPACSERGLVVAGMRDVLVCLDPKTGEEKWRVDCPQQMGTPLPMFGASCSPLIDGDAVYMQTGGATVRFSIDDGSVVWKTLENGQSKEAGAFSSPVIATIAGERQLLVQTRMELCGVDLETGSVLWRQPIEAYRGMNILTPLVIGDRIFTSAHSGRAQLFEIKRDGDAWAVDQIWEQKQQAYMSSPVTVGDRIYLHLKNERMTAFDVESGEPAFTTRPIGKYASMVADGERILALTNDGNLMLIDATAEDYKLLDETKVAENSWAHVALADDLLVVRDLGKLKVYQITSSESN